MNVTIDCPPIEVLWPAAVGEPVEEHVEAHLEWCAECAERVTLLKEQIDAARNLCRAADCDEDESVTTSGNAEGSSAAVDPFHRECSRDDGLFGFKSIGKYLVIETIADGGQATVYRGVHPSLRNDVAIKWSHRQYAPDDRKRGRLISEAKILANLDHPHVARVHDFDFCDGRPFLVMDYIRGQHLRSYREQRSLSEFEILGFADKLARAVAAAHQLGILHLDLKPENILIDRNDEPILVDFGLSFLSKCCQHRPADYVLFAGTPSYMAPEQVRGVVDDLSPRTDVFGLGSVLYFLCTGNDPPTDDDTRETAGHPSITISAAHLSRAGISGRLKQLIQRATAQSSDDRYSGAAELAAAVKEQRDRRIRLASWRRRTFAILLALAGLLLLEDAQSLQLTDPVRAASSLEIELRRNGASQLFDNSLPLRTDDNLRLRAVIGESGHVMFVAMMPGRPPLVCQPVDIASEVNRRKTIIAFPGDQGFIDFALGQQPIAFLLLARNDRPIRRSDVSQLVGLTEIPRLADDIAVSFSQNGTRTLGLTGRPVPSEVTAWLDQLRQQVPDDIDDISGIILPGAQSIGSGRSPKILQATFHDS